MNYRNIVIGVGVLCAILFVALAYSVMTYTAMLQDKDATIASLRGQSSTSPNTSDKDAIIADQQNQINSLQGQVDSLKSAKLISVNLKADDSRPFLQTPRVHVYGYVVNVGTNTANNARIHVVLYQSGGVIAEDTYIDLGSIGGESSKSVDTNVFYEGSEITSKTITLEWT
jgi:hypothetical protein